MAIVKLLSDFDGVWTNQEIEAEYVWNYMVNALSNLTGETPAAIDKLLADCKKDMDRAPYDYGWFNNGAIAAYYRKTPLGITTRYWIISTARQLLKLFQILSSSFIILKTAY